MASDSVCQGILGPSESLDRWPEEDKITRVLDTHQEKYSGEDKNPVLTFLLSI